MERFQLIAGELVCGENAARATGTLEGHYVLVVRAGSTAKGHWIIDERMLQQGVVQREGELLRFKFDFPFPNPTTAAEYILGQGKSGWLAWKSTSGQTLRELMRLAGWEWLIG